MFFLRISFFPFFVFFHFFPSNTKTTGSQLGSEGGKGIAEALKINSSIQHLNLESNEFFLRISFFPFFVFFHFFPQTPKLTQKTKSISKTIDNSFGDQKEHIKDELRKKPSPFQFKL
jgi:hypothetical protein